jgi:drug/metabolite transporter (DMT)-like permease
MRLSDLSLLLCGVLLNTGAQLGLKTATRATGPIDVAAANLRGAAVALAAEPAFWGALTAYGLSVLVWVVGLSRVPVSQAYPLLSLGYVVNAVLAWWLLGEAVTAVRMAGIGVIIVGVVLVVKS